MQSTCTFPGCENPHYALGLCDGHYQQQRKHQKLRSLRPKTLNGRFWANVDKNALGGCWEWTGAPNDSGYGRIRVNGQKKLAYRVSWEFTNGPTPEGMMIDHRCANRLCVNPAHLRAVTRSQNMQHLTGPQKNSTSGVRGVSWDKENMAWKVQVTLNRRNYWGGYHSTIEAADAAARALRAQLFTHDDHEQWIQEKDTKGSDRP